VQASDRWRSPTQSRVGMEGFCDECAGRSGSRTAQLLVVCILSGPLALREAAVYGFHGLLIAMLLLLHYQMEDERHPWWTETPASRTTNDKAEMHLTSANARAFAICFNEHLPSRIWHAQKSCRNAKLTSPMNSGWLGSDSGSSPSLVRVDFRLSHW
jgi:hypothetical protein